jgi:predicted SPOUT superfamily RNA methylase MTH1
MGAYSFLDVQASIEGPGGAFQLGSGIGVAEEGITIEPTGDKNMMNIGADGSAMHSLRADASATVTVTLQRTSLTNAKLQGLYNFQTTSSRYHGQNTIIVRNSVSGDVIVCSEVAFAKAISNPYAVEGAKLAWSFHAGKVSTVLGTGTPEK